jgi:hypothetical protein
MNDNHTTSNELSREIKRLFFENDPDGVNGIPYMHMTSVSVEDAESIAFDVECPEIVSENFRAALEVAAEAKSGRLQLTGSGISRPEDVELVLYNDGLWVTDFSMKVRYTGKTEMIMRCSDVEELANSGVHKRLKDRFESAIETAANKIGKERAWFFVGLDSKSPVVFNLQCFTLPD